MSVAVVILSASCLLYCKHVLYCPRDLPMTGSYFFLFAHLALKHFFILRLIRDVSTKITDLIILTSS